MIGYPSKHKGSILPALDFPLFFCKIKFSSVDSISSFIAQACSVKIVDIGESEAILTLLLDLTFLDWWRNQTWN